MIPQAGGARDARLLPPDFCEDSVFSINYKFKTRQGAGALCRSEMGPQEAREPRPQLGQQCSWGHTVRRSPTGRGQPAKQPPTCPCSSLHRPVPSLPVPFFCPARSVKAAGSDICAATAWVLEGEEIP